MFQPIEISSVTNRLPVGRKLDAELKKFSDGIIGPECERRELCLLQSDSVMPKKSQ
jgi:hypothetical protein